jgi:S-adenosylmethionine-diacylglycerol 3-amino-3-carboxypropyl transferase
MSFLFDKGFFKYLKEDFSFGNHFAEKVKKAFLSLPLKENYFLHYILFGNYDENYLPAYLRKVNYEIIKSRLDRIKIITDSCENYFNILSDNSISRFNFTNIFEWISDEAFENLLKETIRVAKNYAVITYRNLLVLREHPESLSQNIFSNKQVADELQQKDLSFIYNNYVVEKIIKEEEKWDIQLPKYQLEKN